jgi:hypothetical protein
MCDSATGVMVYMEVEERKNAMRENEYAAEHGVSTARVLRMAEDASDEGMTLLGDAWFRVCQGKRSVTKFIVVMCYVLSYVG